MEAASIVRIPIGTPEDVRSTVENQIRRNVGPGCYINSSQKCDGKFVFEIGNSFHEILDDSRLEISPRIRTRGINSVFTVDVIDDKGRYAILLPDISIIVESMKKRVNTVAAKSEAVIVEKAYDRFLTIPTVRMALNPIIQILDAVDESESITLKDIYHRKGNKKIQQYMDFLIQMNFISFENGAYVRGSRFDEHMSSESDERLHKLLASVLENGMEYLQSYFHMTMLTPFVRLSNSYYYPSGSSGNLIWMYPDLLRNYEMRYYNYSRSVKQINAQARQMKMARIFERHDGYITGEESLFSEYCSAMHC